MAESTKALALRIDPAIKDGMQDLADKHGRTLRELVEAMWTLYGKDISGLWDRHAK